MQASHPLNSEEQDLITQAEKSRGRLYRIALSLCRDPDLADDLAQETLASAWRNKDKLRDVSAINTWLFRILSNCWRDHYRRNPVLTDLSAADPADDITPEDACCLDEMVVQVRTAVMSLPCNQRDVVTLVHLSGRSLLEAAGLLEIPAGTVMSRLFRARRALRYKLSDACIGTSSLL